MMGLLVTADPEIQRALDERRRTFGALPGSLESSVEELGRVAPLEAWWLTAELARAFRVDGWQRLAQERAYDLAKRSGPYAETLRQAVNAAPPRST